MPEELTILKQSLTSYKHNSELLIPVLFSTVTLLATGYVVSGILQQLGSINSGQALAQPTVDLLSSALPYVLAFGLISFLVELGLITMVARIVTKRKCKLLDWLTGIKTYFWRILNVSIVITVLFALVSAVPLSLHSQQAPRIFSSSIENLVSALGQLISYVCYAAIMIDDANLLSSINLAIKTIRASGRTFWTFFALFFIALNVKTIIGTPNPLAIGRSLSLTGPLPIVMDVPNIAYAIAWSFLAPLWLLIIFTLYRRVRRNCSKANP